MVECDFYRKEVDEIYRCTSCGGYFCREHRLQKLHDCPDYFRESRAREAAAYALHRIFLTESHQDSEGTNFGKLFSFSGRELNHLTICILIMAVIPIMSFGITIFRNPTLLIGAVTLFFAAFLFHELGHKFSAQLMGYWAEFQLNSIGLFITLMSLFSPIKLVAPGAVVIAGRTDFDEFGKIALSGPLTNIA